MKAYRTLLPARWISRVSLGMLALLSFQALAVETVQYRSERSVSSEERARSERVEGRDYPPLREPRATIDIRQAGIEVDVDAARLIDGMPRSRQQETLEDTGPSICRQSHSIAWSTRELECPDSQPAPRSHVWSTSP
ncbi:MAG: hypothetical protein UMU75_03500 [Halomonas sp.]|nr:hypothetical protein [Halomonas sp.]